MRRCLQCCLFGLALQNSYLARTTHLDTHFPHAPDTLSKKFTEDETSDKLNPVTLSSLAPIANEPRPTWLQLRETRVVCKSQHPQDIAPPRSGEGMRIVTL
ncbi:hypothetical protein K439DRAFT_1631723 [Ramaria rubella]|nr:hypothetical protein K439DRAFT_1631723 [Ramaria rubella]